MIVRLPGWIKHFRSRPRGLYTRGGFISWGDAFSDVRGVLCVGVDWIGLGFVYTVFVVGGLTG